MNRNTYNKLKVKFDRLNILRLQKGLSLERCKIHYREQFKFNKMCLNNPPKFSKSEKHSEIKKHIKADLDNNVTMLESFHTTLEDISECNITGEHFYIYSRHDLINYYSEKKIL